MAQMLTTSTQAPLHRDQVLRDEITAAASSSDKKATAITAYVSHLASTASTLRGQFDTNSDFAVDAIQQVRAGFRAEIDAKFEKIASSDRASNAGATGPALRPISRW